MTIYKETSKLKTEKSISFGKTFIWPKFSRVVKQSANIGVAEIWVGNFLEKEQLFRKFRATCGQGCCSIITSCLGVGWFS